jgi:hypothetical protein
MATDGPSQERNESHGLLPSRDTTTTRHRVALGGPLSTTAATLRRYDDRDRVIVVWGSLCRSRRPVHLVRIHQQDPLLGADAFARNTRP